MNGKSAAVGSALAMNLAFWSGREVYGMRGGAVQCKDIAQNFDCEGRKPALNWS